MVIRQFSGPAPPSQPFALKDFKPPVRGDEVFANEYGVAGDGTDQTNNLTRALTAAAAAGKVLVIPPGTYYALDVVVPAGTKLRGFGPTSILKRPATGGGGLSNVLRINGSNVTISDLKLDGNRAGLAMADGRGVIDGFVADVDNILIERCVVTEGAQSGVRYVDHGSEFSVRDCQITNMDGVAVFIQQTSQDGEGVSLIRNQVDGCEYGLLVRGSNDGTTWFQSEVTIAENRVRNVVGLCIESWCADASITGNVTVGGAFGISNGPGNRTSITGNVVNDATTIGIEAAAAVNAEWAAVHGNTIRGAGISVSDSADYVSIVGNTIEGTVSATGAAIHVIDANRATVSNNVIKTNTNYPYGIRFQSGVTAVCTGNYIDHTAPNGGLGDNGIFFGDVTKFTCVGNVVENCTYGIRLVSATSVYEGTVSANVLTDNTDPYDAALSGGASAAAVVFGTNQPVVP